jgi:hypothetical protein
MLVSWLFTVARQAADVGSPSTFSQSTEHHAIAPGSPGPLDETLVVLGVVVVLVTTFYSLLYLVHPGEAAADHIKRRVLEERGDERR